MAEPGLDDNSSEYQVSDKWRTRFALLEKIGADKQFIFQAAGGDGFKALPFKQRQKISFNLFAFLFGPFYYFGKKMWHKGALLLALTWLWSCLVFIIEMTLETKLASIAYWIVPAAICAQLANYDYFRFITQQEKIWPGLPAMFTSTPGIIASPLLALGLLFGLVWQLMPAQTPQCYSSEVTELVIELSEKEILKHLTSSEASDLNLTLKAINTTDMDQHTLAYQCAAQLHVDGPDISNSIPVNYSVALIDNGKAFNVSVFL
ncbi:DUF2628 domain-containing protein [Thalassomonas actiniarum]|uniref:DUF2628 domain-containing protein n=1 Tax=Thalassomonas actiniarum TaxID=485447 RepID=A0AAF0C577_9GAMM|nr:DUF2628 domain-containing protein [Thalassomonas actiniarum]WDE00779.1 DUF2628 domain-containing protein [Thalassomonas actiniarum]